MQAVTKGDRVVVHPKQLGGHKREGEVVEARGPGGTAPFLVRWSDTASESVIFPGPGTVIVPAREGAAPSQ
ncbi:DUF1918 domain-containing protein [Georgenia sp. SYP-B2076]|uniref:DUF1918 domain-containing protein n=1 Tax=Georgenia sp. SYP-B2076 TaxID=2495881 RepID=UPI000F8C3F2D|nr:DUF1918 domain-containing protein [Georgenia sp. SYP-B2076]